MRFLLFVILACAVTVLPGQTKPAAIGELEKLSGRLERLTEQLTPAVVQVRSNAYRPAAVQAGGPTTLALRQSTGSGAILSSNGHIVTNAHVVVGATRVQVQLSFPDRSPGRSIVRPPGKILAARVLGMDLETDLALLKIEATKLPFLDLADSDDVRQGQLVLALGNPWGLENSVTMGVISAVARQLRPDDRVIYLQTDAPINPGNSGGPLIDVEGNVIGICTMIASQSGGNEGLGFAVPSNIVRSVTDQLRHGGVVHRGDIGVAAQTITPTLAAGLGLQRDYGVVLADVSPRGPADIAGLRIGDIVLSLNGKPMENARQFHVNLYQYPVASTVNLEVIRRSERMTRKVVVLAREDDPERFASLVDKQRNLIPQLGILGLAIDKKISEMLPPLRRSYGILVAGLATTQRTTSDLLLPGDVIYTLNNQPLSTLHEFRSLLAQSKPGEVIVLQVERGGELRYLEVPLD
jgi:serine protease Do